MMKKLDYDYNWEIDSGFVSISDLYDDDDDDDEDDDDDDV
jgi:hypothetical protein